MTDAHEGPTTARRIPIRRTNPLGLRPAFVNDCTVSHTGAEFYLTFGLIEPPVVLSADDLDHLDSIESATVAKLALTPEFMQILVKALSDNVKSFREKRP